jgi:hypothetical protein
LVSILLIGTGEKKGAANHSDCGGNSPGRFFSVAEMKLILVELINRYDIKLIPGTKPRRTAFGVMIVPETRLKILVRAKRTGT